MTDMEERARQAQAPEVSSEHVCTIDGVQVVNMRGLAQMTNRSIDWVKRAARGELWASEGFPSPIPASVTRVGQSGPMMRWFPLAEARPWAETVCARTPDGQPATGRPRSGQRLPLAVALPEEPDALIGETVFRTEVMQPPRSFKAFKWDIKRSRADWEAGRDGVLPRPVEDRTVRGGVVYLWRADVAVRWQNQRAAQAASS